MTGISKNTFISLRLNQKNKHTQAKPKLGINSLKDHKNQYISKLYGLSDKPMLPSNCSAIQATYP